MVAVQNLKGEIIHPISGLGGVALTRYMDGQVDSYIPPQTLFVGGITRKW
jgi:hypothetical protein